MLKELQDIGLSEKEAKVYLAALEIGRATADQLAKQANIVRSTTYVQLESLMKKGLMSTYEEGKKTFFAPESPELLKRLLTQQREGIGARERELESFLPFLLQQFAGAGERPVVRFFPGKEGVTAVREEALKLQKKETFVIFSYGHLSKIYPERELDDYSTRRRALGILSKAIYVQEAPYEKAGLGELTERRHLPLPQLTIDIWVFDDKVAIYSLQGHLFALVIQSAQIASSVKILFDFLWDKAQRPTINN
jgi:HTH-type transcriptional regulator, sugar sensing transcriptional regulator